MHNKSIATIEATIGTESMDGSEQGERRLPTRRGSFATEGYNRSATSLKKLTTSTPFGTIIAIAIVYVGVVTGLELDNDGRDPAIVELAKTSTMVTGAIFTVEVVLKLIAEGAYVHVR